MLGQGLGSGQGIRWTLIQAGLEERTDLAEPARAGLPGPHVRGGKLQV